MWHGVVFNCQIEQAVEHIRLAFERQGLSVVRSFDLRTALTRQAHPEGAGEAAAECGCQYVVFLVYSGQSEPATLTLHGDQQRTAAQIAYNPAAVPGPHLVKTVMAGLYEAVLGVAGLPIEGEAADGLG